MYVCVSLVPLGALRKAPRRGLMFRVRVSLQVICFPENVTFSDYTSALPFLRQDEVCHVLLLAIESRRQSELLYALNALMAHVNG